MSEPLRSYSPITGKNKRGVQGRWDERRAATVSRRGSGVAATTTTAAAEAPRHCGSTPPDNRRTLSCDTARWSRKRG